MMRDKAIVTTQSIYNEERTPRTCITKLTSSPSSPIANNLLEFGKMNPITQTEGLLRSFKEQSIDKQVGTQNQAFLVGRGTLRELYFDITGLVVNIAELFFWDLEHFSDVRGVSVGVFCVGGVDSERNKATSMWARVSFGEEINA
jgi:hypothetical protein